MIIVDLDGTLTKVSDQAAHCMGETHTKADILRIMDPVKIARLEPRLDVIEAINDKHHSGEEVRIITGRWDLLRPITIAWLKQYNVYYDFLFMRKHEDWERKSVDVKMEIFKSFNRHKYGFDATWYDDDQEMLDAANEIGVKAVKC